MNKEIIGNQFQPAAALGVTGDHLRLVASIGIHEMVKRVNIGLLGGEKRLAESDLPGKVSALVEQAKALAEQICRCDAIDVHTASDYVAAQAKLATTALPLMVDELQRRERAARDAIAALRANLTGKGNNLVGAAAEVLLRATNVVGAVEVEAGLMAWRSAMAIVRDTAANKNVPRWLKVMVSQHEAAKLAV